jgi:hypothetical protein
MVSVASPDVFSGRREVLDEEELRLVVNVGGRVA